MKFTRAFIPYGAYWTSPFCRWQGGLATAHPLELAAQTAREALAGRKLPVDALDGLVLGTTVPARAGFYGAPWLAGMLGAPAIGGPTIGQACATSARILASAAAEVETGQRQCLLAVAADRTSWGPHIYYPAPRNPGGRGETEDWVWDNFNRDPFAGKAMIATAEAVAAEAGLERSAQDEITALRHQQYQEALADDRAFQRRYMVPVKLPRGRGKFDEVTVDDGVRKADLAAMRALAPVLEGGTVTAATQTFPADGNAGALVTTEARARELAPAGAPRVQLVAFGEARVAPGHMPAATVPAARQALERAGLAIADVRAIKTHNPFAVNDVYFCKTTGVAADRLNRFGSPLVYGHPQAPTGLRCVIELIEELVLAGGGHGLFVGCAAGDTAMAVVVEVR